MRARDYITATVNIRDAEVDIDVDDLSDEDIQTILNEAGKRGLSVFYDRDYAERAFEALLGKRYAEAAALLDRALYPYPSRAAVAEYMKGLKQLPLAQQAERGG